MEGYRLSMSATRNAQVFGNCLLFSLMSISVEL